MNPLDSQTLSELRAILSRGTPLNDQQQEVYNDLKAIEKQKIELLRLSRSSGSKLLFWSYSY